MSGTDPHHSTRVAAVGPSRPAEIARVEDCSVEDWEAEFAGAHEATFFHSPLWSRIWQEYSHGRYRPAPVRVAFADGRSALLARTVRRSRYGVLQWHLSPAGTYGGWLSPEPLPTEHQEALRDLASKAGSVSWSEQPPAPSRQIGGTPLGTTYVIDLRDGADPARARWESEARRLARRAQRGGIEVREAQSWSDWGAYFDNYLETRKLWDTPTSSYDLPLFRLLWEARSPAVRLWLAEREGAVVGGALFFTRRTSAVGWHSAQAPRGTGAANLLQWEILAVLAADGIGAYDLGPSGGHAGVVRFKESLGARTVGYRRLLRRHPVERGLAELVGRARRLR